MTVDRRPRGVAWVLDQAIRGYQAVSAGRPSPCRYVPSCSTYAREALAVHGAARGTWYAARRLGRCHPWGRHGYDPVPGTEPATGPAADAAGPSSPPPRRTA